MPDLSELMLQSMEIMIDGSIKKINYDTTKTYIIKSIPEPRNGDYIVTDGSVTFTAYSDASYRVGETVYVQVPEGDFNNQKNIIGRKVIESKEPYNYVRPLDQIAAQPQQIFENRESWGLIANKAKTGQSSDIKTVFEWEYKKDITPELRGYDKLVVSADFDARFSANKGTYGLHITLWDATGTDYHRVFSTMDMFGNLYPTGGFFPQDILFDIGNINPIVKIKVEFFEQSDFEPIWEQGLITATGNNLFMKNLVLRFGIGNEIQGFNIICDDGTEGIYNVYDTDGNILDLNLHSLQRTLSIDLSKDITPDELVWVFPKSTKSMIEKASEDPTDSTYYIGEKLYNKYNDNIVKAIIKIGNKTYKAEKTLVFGQQGTFNDNKLLSFQYDKHYALLEDGCPHDPIIGTLKILDAAKQPVQINDYEETIKVNNSEVSIVSEDIKNEDETITSKKIIIKNDQEISLIDKPYIVADLNYKKDEEDLKLRLPIAVSANRDEYTYITGPTEIKYTPTGLPDFLREKYVIYNKDKEVVDKDITWIVYNTTLYQKGQYYKLLTDADGKLLGDYILCEDEEYNPDIEYFLKDGKKKVHFYKPNKYYYYLMENGEGKYDIDKNSSKTDGRIYFNQRIEYQIAYLTEKEYNDDYDKKKYYYYYGDIKNENGEIIGQDYIELSGEKYEPYDGRVYYSKIDKYDQIELVSYIDRKFYNENDELLKDLTEIPDVGYKQMYTPIPLYGEPTISLDFRIENDTLTPLGTYFNNLEKQELLLIGRIKEENEYRIIWACPILIYKDGGRNSSFNNKWDGQDNSIKDLDVYSKSLMVGYNRAGGFTGVTIGEFVDSVGDYNERHTGLYGFNKGASVFGLRDNGSAFFGRDGNGRILIDGEKSYLSSQEYLKSNGNDGLMIDFDDGYMIFTDSTAQYDEDGNKINRFIQIDSEASNTPFKIGPYFYVNWDGSLYSKHGIFEQATINVADITKAYINTSYLGGSYKTKKYTWRINSSEISTKGFEIQDTNDSGVADKINGIILSLDPPEGASFKGSNSYIGAYYFDIWEANIGGVYVGDGNPYPKVATMNDIADLQNQINNLETRVDGLTSSMKNAFERISALESIDHSKYALASVVGDRLDSLSRRISNIKECTCSSSGDEE